MEVEYPVYIIHPWSYLQHSASGNITTMKHFNANFSPQGHTSHQRWIITCRNQHEKHSPRQGNDSYNLKDFQSYPSSYFLNLVCLHYRVRFGYRLPTDSLVVKRTVMVLRISVTRAECAPASAFEPS